MIYYDRIDVSRGIDVNKTGTSKEWDIAILSIKGFDYCCIISRISRNWAIKLMQNVKFTEKKVEHYKTYKFAITYKNGYRNFNFWRY